MEKTQNWYIVKQDNGRCAIVDFQKNESPDVEHWGPFMNQEEAIARRVGLIRAGKCQPN